MKKIISIKLLVLSFIGTINGQQVLTTGGDYFSAINGSVSITIGEPVTETFPGVANILTQGFQQSRLKVMGIAETPENNYDIIVFPNPVRDFLTIKVWKYSKEQFIYKLFDFQGRIIIQGEIEPPETEISLQNQNPSVYFLRIYANYSLAATYKIVKQ